MGDDLLFKPLLSKNQAQALCKEYPLVEDAEFLKAGQAIRSGDFSRIHFNEIFRWKTKNRGKSRPKQNSDEEIAEALRVSTILQSPKLAIALLCGLTGVAIPVASSIMTAIYPERFTIIDFRALEALDAEPERSGSLSYYECYLTFCTKLAKDWEISLRELDRALWMWSKKTGSA
jgi:hypothetical protein